MRARRPLVPPSRDERGAVAIVTALALVLLLASAALAVDLGKQRVVRSDMQALADVVSLDLARALEGDDTQTLLASSAFRDRVRASVAGNDGVLGDEPEVRVEVGDFATQFTSFGWVDYDSAGAGSFSAPTMSSPGAVPGAVRVTSQGSVAFAFASGSGGASRSAVSVVDAGGCFTLGSYAARVALGDSFILGPLLGVLGTDVDLSVLDLEGLADTQITVLDLLETDLTAGGFDQLLAATVSLDDFMLAVADAVEANSGQTAEVELLRDLVALPLPALDVMVGELLDLQSGSSTALSAVVNVLDLVAGGVFVGNGLNPIRLPLSLGVGTVTNVEVDVVIGQKPILTCGREGVTDAETSQVSVIIGGNLANIDLGLARISAPVLLEVALDPADASLTGLRCEGEDRMLDLTVSSGLLDLDVAVGDPQDPGALSVRALGATIADGYILASGSRSAGAVETGTVTVREGDYAAAPPFEAGDGNIGLPALSLDSQLGLLSGVPLLGYIVNTVLGGLLNGVVNPLLQLVINPLVQALDVVVLSPLLEALGINLTGADVHAAPVAECALPRLVQ